MCYRTGKYTVCRRVRVSFSMEIVQAPAVKGLMLNLETHTEPASSVSCKQLDYREGSLYKSTNRLKQPPS